MESFKVKNTDNKENPICINIFFICFGTNVLVGIEYTKKVHVVGFNINSGLSYQSKGELNHVVANSY